MKKEYRSNSNELIATEESRKIYGCAIKFNSESQDIGWIETISPDAIDDELIQRSDIFALLNHNEDDVLARSRYGEGSLTLEIKEDGLYYEFDCPHTAKGDELLEHIRRGEISTSSFGFTLPEDGSGERWNQDEDGTLRRLIIKIDRLYDVSPVYEPAYLETSCDKRALDEVNKRRNSVNKYLDSEMTDIYKYEIKLN